MNPTQRDSAERALAQLAEACRQCGEAFISFGATSGVRLAVIEAAKEEFIIAGANQAGVRPARQRLFCWKIGRKEKTVLLSMNQQKPFSTPD